MNDLFLAFPFLALPFILPKVSLSNHQLTRYITQNQYEENTKEFYDDAVGVYIWRRQS
jgi:hypothetical protein